jgi:hypothetical protein
MNDDKAESPHRFALRRFEWTLAAILGAYFLVSTAYTLRLPLIMDEYQGARAVFDAGRKVPYRDFQPYKTVVGYYIQLPFLSLPGDLWQKMMAVKIAMAALTAAVLFAVASRLRRWFDDSAVLIAVAMLVAHSTFLERSAELRVDMLTALAGLLGLSALLSGAPLVAGLFTALSFLVSQKGAYYVVAAGIALLASASPGRRIKTSLRYWGAAAGVLLVYVLAWAAAADFSSVVATTFFAPRTVFFETTYSIRREFWSQTLERNPAFYLWCVISIALILWRAWRGPRAERPVHRTLGAYALLLSLAVVLHNQPWPYFFVLWLPTLFVVSAGGVHVATRHLVAPEKRRALVLTLLGLAVILPLLRVPPVLSRDSSLQRESVLLARRILAPHDTYIAGTEMVWDREQSHPRLAWLGARRLNDLRMAPRDEVESLLEAVRSAPPKVIVLNWRLLQLPEPLKSHLRRNYAHWRDCVYVYAPRVDAGEFHLSFDGSYVLEASSPVVLDGRPWAPRHVRRLHRGRHTAEASEEFTLHFIPANAPAPMPERSCPDFFAGVYTF